jgi:polygalacturonase/lysophospholipase L1-like esterase
MAPLMRSGSLALLLSLLSGLTLAATEQGPLYDVRAFGAQGDGRTLDTEAINRAIEAAAAAGGGTVVFPAGTYPSFSIHLKSHVALYLGPGATLLAADPSQGNGRYDAAEPSDGDLYQDFGHSHWQNSLIWGIGLDDVSIIGPGRIDGKGLTRRGPGARWSSGVGNRPLSMGPARIGPGPAEDPEAAGLRAMEGQGNKAIALKLCRNVVLRDFSVQSGGHFVLLATGVDNLTVDNLKLDTNRDGLDIDACRNVRISNTSINSPNDDAIVLKSSYALGFPRATENVTITNCQVTGYDLGSFLDGTFKRTQEQAPDRDGPTGRIKLGTESNGGFRNITISNCVFDRSRGLAIETVDGGIIEDITITNLSMREVTTAPLFLRLGARGRGPDSPAAGRMRRIQISHVVAYDADPRYASIIAGVPGHPVEDVQLSNIQIVYKGGGAQDAGREPPENEAAYPEPSMFGTLPGYGFFLRHARNVTMRDIEIGFAAEDLRPPFVLHDVAGAHLAHVRAQRGRNAPFAVLRDVTGLEILDSPGLPDTRRERVERETLGLPTLFLIGDSTVRNGRGDGANGQWGWGEPIAAYFDLAKVNVVNRAIGGRSSRTFLTEGRWDQVLAELKPGDFVMMQFGHNDGGELFKGSRPRASLKGIGEETQEGTVEQTGKRELVHSYGWYLRRYVRDAQAKGATPIVCSPVPRKIWKDGRIVRASDDYGRWAAEVASSQRTAFVDLNEIIARRYDALGPQKVEALFADEHTHTNAPGAELNAVSAVAALKGLEGCPLCAYLSPKARDTGTEKAKDE